MALDLEHAVASLAHGEYVFFNHAFKLITSWLKYI